MNFTEEDKDYQSKIIGEFFVQFDMAISTIPFTIPKIIYKKSCSNIEERNIETLLSGAVASSLKIMFDSLIIDNYKELPQLINSNNELSKIVDKIMEIRNSFAHGSYRLGWKDFEGNLDKNYFSLRHSKATKKGYEKRSWIFRIEQVEKIIKQLMIVNRSYLNISTIIFLHYQNLETDTYINNLASNIVEIGKIEFKPIHELK